MNVCVQMLSINKASWSGSFWVFVVIPACHAAYRQTNGTRVSVRPEWERG